MRVHRTAVTTAAVLTAVLLALPLAAEPAVPGGEPGAGEHPSPFAADAEIRAVGQRISHLPGGVRDKADAVLDFIFDPSRGLGFEYRNRPTRTAAEAFRARDGNCLSLVNLYLALARAAGLDAFPVEVEDFETFHRQGGTVVRATHVVGGLMVTGMVLTVDFLPDHPKTYRRIDRISDRRHAALHYNAVATEAMLDGEAERAADLYREALRLEPGNAEAWNNYAVLAKRQGERRAARQRFERALEHDPTFLPTLNNLAALNRIEGRTAEAAALEARALEQRAQSPYFLTEQALRRIAGGDLASAEQLLVRARRIDKTIPEIHLALGRIDLARGNEGGAARHFEDARERSRELSDAYRRGLDTKIDKLGKLAKRGG